MTSNRAFGVPVNGERLCLAGVDGTRLADVDFGPVGLPFSQRSETYGEAIRLKGDWKPFASTFKGEER
jgi:hypothetical protein